MLALPDKSRSDFNVLISELRAFLEEGGYSPPPGETCGDLSVLESTTKRVKNEFDRLILNETLSDQINLDQAFWTRLMLDFKHVPKKLKRHRKEIEVKGGAKPGPNWSYRRQFVEVVERILRRHGRSLANPDGDSKKSEKFLQGLFKFGGDHKLEARNAASLVTWITKRRREASRAESSALLSRGSAGA
jgi:hypothetical protein